MSVQQEWPLVAVNDDELRPAGKPEECYYCKQKIGTPHGSRCVCVTKRVRLRYSYEVKVDIPHFWTVDDIEFHRNESSWCADNSLDDLEKMKGQHGCLCHVFSAEFLGVVDETPQRRLRDSEEP